MILRAYKIGKACRGASTDFGQLSRLPSASKEAISVITDKNNHEITGSPNRHSDVPLQLFCGSERISLS